jgi:hypothetical protein
MKKVILVLATLLVVFVIACNKNQQVVKQLDGSWKVTSQTVNGVAAPDSTYKNTTYSFTKCKVKKGDCDGTITDGSFTIPIKYSVTEDGKKIKITYNFLGTSETETGDITEHSKDKMVISTTQDGETTVITLAKK